jgi:hypothetical protein
MSLHAAPVLLYELFSVAETGHSTLAAPFGATYCAKS